MYFSIYCDLLRFIAIYCDLLRYIASPTVCANNPRLVFLVRIPFLAAVYLRRPRQYAPPPKTRVCLQPAFYPPQARSTYLSCVLVCFVLGPPLCVLGRWHTEYQGRPPRTGWISTTASTASASFSWGRRSTTSWRTRSSECCWCVVSTFVHFFFFCRRGVFVDTAVSIVVIYSALVGPRDWPQDAKRSTIVMLFYPHFVFRCDERGTPACLPPPRGSNSLSNGRRARYSGVCCCRCLSSRRSFDERASLVLDLCVFLAQQPVASAACALAGRRSVSISFCLPPLPARFRVSYAARLYTLSLRPTAEPRSVCVFCVAPVSFCHTPSCRVA